MRYSSTDVIKVLSESKYYRKKNRKFYLQKKKCRDKSGQVVEIRRYYLNVAMGFDIEDTSWYVDENGEQWTVPQANILIDNELEYHVDRWHKCATMYHWQFAIDEMVFFGRTWPEFIEFLDNVKKFFGLCEDHLAIIAVHNLAHEFAYMAPWFNWESVFSIKKRKPVSSITTEGFDFRCTYILTGKSLAEIGEEVGVPKLKGDLDYGLLRHSGTPLTEKELDYCANDVLILTAYMNQKMTDDGNISKVLLTKTSYVREYCRDAVLKETDFITGRRVINEENQWWISNLTMTPGEYKMWRQAYAGGFTHANYRNVGMLHVSVDDITTFTDEEKKRIKRHKGKIGSYDLTSSYPAALVSGEFPIGKGVRIPNPTQKEFREYVYGNKYCCMFNVEITGLEAKENVPDHFLSLSKCYNIDLKSPELIVDNGRVVKCPKCTITVTHLDWIILTKAYNMKTATVFTLWRYKKGRLPRELVEAVLHFYRQKTELKGEAGKERLYMLYKENCNSIYGMMVSSIIRSMIAYEDGWEIEEPILEEALSIENNKKNRFLYYGWGVYCCAIARFRLQSVILQIDKDDYLYSDTDSIKMINYEKYTHVIDKFNENVDRAMRRACKDLHLDYESTRPETISHEKKPLGVFDFEGELRQFRTLGAKRYGLLHKDKKGNWVYETTIAGVNKETGLQFFQETAEKNGTSSPLLEMNLNVTIPTTRSGKLMSTYVDDELRVVMKDYLGNEAECYEKSYVHLSGTRYHMSADKFEEFLVAQRVHYK